MLACMGTVAAENVLTQTFNAAPSNVGHFVRGLILLKVLACPLLNVILQVGAPVDCFPTMAALPRARPSIACRVELAAWAWCGATTGVGP